ncbi:MAG: protein jag [Patescibacteria group bacterium]
MKQESSRLLEEILTFIGIKDYELEQIELDDQSIKFHLSKLSDRDSALLIGKQGETMQALQYLLRSVLRSNLKLTSGEEKCIEVDVMNYRQRQLDHLTILAKRKAQEAKISQRDILLRPMTPYERRIIHMTLKEDESILTSSIGKEPNRQVLIKIISNQVEI